MLSDEFIKQVYGEEESAAEMLKKASGMDSNDQVKFLTALLARTNLEEDSVYKEIVSSQPLSLILTFCLDKNND